MKKKPSKKELSRFLIGGGTAVITDYILYNAFMSMGMSTSLSKGISFFCGASVGFVINKLWTFESRGFRKSEVLKYITLYLITAVINAGINRLSLDLLKVHLWAFFCATGVSTVLNFIGQKYFVFIQRGDSGETINRDTML